MEELTKLFSRLKLEFGTLSNDIKRMAADKKKEAAGEKNDPKRLRTMQNVTTLYSSKKEIVNAKNNPEIDFVERALNRILNK